MKLLTGLFKTKKKKLTRNSRGSVEMFGHDQLKKLSEKGLSFQIVVL